MLQKCCNSIGQKAAIPCKGEARAALGLKRLLAALLLEDDDRPGACSTGTTHSDTADAEVGDAKHPLHAAALKVAKTSKQVMWQNSSCQDSVAAVPGMHVYHDKARGSKHTVCI